MAIASIDGLHFTEARLFASGERPSSGTDAAGERASFCKTPTPECVKITRLPTEPPAQDGHHSRIQTQDPKRFSSSMFEDVFKLGADVHFEIALGHSASSRINISCQDTVWTYHSRSVECYNDTRP